MNDSYGDGWSGSILQLYDETDGEKEEIVMVDPVSNPNGWQGGTPLSIWHPLGERFTSKFYGGRAASFAFCVLAGRK
jgi:hypothetical protein